MLTAESSGAALQHMRWKCWKRGTIATAFILKNVALRTNLHSVFNYITPLLHKLYLKIESSPLTAKEVLSIRESNSKTYWYAPLF